MQIARETDEGRGSATLMLHLLGRCNLTCLHCYMDGSPSRKERLPLDRVLGAVAECRPLDIGALYLTGGEPLFYRGLEEVLRAAADVPGMETTLCTNGSLLKPRHAELLGELGVKVSHLGSTWWEFEQNGRTWKIRGASNVIRNLELMKA